MIVDHMNQIILQFEGLSCFMYVCVRCIILNINYDILTASVNFSTIMVCTHSKFLLG